jgi:HrpA-like RNA helicase
MSENFTNTIYSIDKYNPYVVLRIIEQNNLKIYPDPYNTRLNKSLARLEKLGYITNEHQITERGKSFIKTLSDLIID